MGGLGITATRRTHGNSREPYRKETDCLVEARRAVQLRPLRSIEPGNLMGPSLDPSSGPPNCSTSLQLAPIYAFARQHGGTATIRSGPKDTTMSIYLAAADKS